MKILRNLLRKGYAGKAAVYNINKASSANCNGFPAREHEETREEA